MKNKERIIIYGRDTCPFCTYSVDLCIAEGIPHVFLNYSEQPDILDECKDFYNHPTVPITLSNNLQTGLVSFIGGYSDLVEHLS